MDFKKAIGGVYARNFLYAGSIGILMLSLLLGCSPMVGTWPPLKVDAASGGYSHTMVLKSDGSLWQQGISLWQQGIIVMANLVQGHN